MINVAQKLIEGGDALGTARLDLPPFSRSDDARQQVVREDPLGASLTAVNVESDSLIEKGKIGCLLAPPELVDRNREQPAVQLPVVRAWIARAIEHFVPSVVKLIPGERATVGDSRGRGHRERPAEPQWLFYMESFGTGGCV